MTELILKMAPEDTLSQDENKQTSKEWGASCTKRRLFVVASEQFCTDIKELCHEAIAVLGQFCALVIT